MVAVVVLLLLLLLGVAVDGVGGSDVVAAVMTVAQVALVAILIAEKSSRRMDSDGNGIPMADAAAIDRP